MSARNSTSRAQVLQKWRPELQKSRVYEQILFDVIVGNLKPGSHLDEANLVKRYGHGIAGIRDALSRLALEGLVQRLPRAGTTVAQLDLMEVQQVFEARILVEGHCAALAAEKARPDDVKLIKGAFRDVGKAITNRDYAALVQMDQVFHRAVAVASQNEPLAKMVVTLHNSAVRFWHYSLSRRPEAQLKLEIELHLEVANAIGKGEAAGAAQAMRHVLGLFPDSLRHFFLANPSEPSGSTAK